MASIFDIFKQFGQKAGGSSVIVVDSGEAVWQPRDYEAFSKEGYESNPYVFAAISEIARSVAGLPYKIMQVQNDGTSHVVLDPRNPVVDLFARPNPEQSSATFLEAAVSYYLIAGNCFIESVGPDNGPPRELWLLRPDRMKVVPGRDGQNYKYSVNGKDKFIDGEKVLHIKAFSPTSDYYGCSPMMSAARSIDSNSESRRWNFNLLKNNAKVTFALTTDGELTDQQRQRIKEEFTEKYSGANNAGKPKVFEGGIKPHGISQSPEQMDWSEGIRLSGKEIAIAFGVPPELIGDSQNRSYASYAEARKSFYMETVLPIAEVVIQELNMWLLPKLGDGFVIEIDRDNIDALQEDRSEVWTRTMNAVSSGVLTINEARDLLGYPPMDGGNDLSGLEELQAEPVKKLALPPHTKTVRSCTQSERDPDRPYDDQIWCTLTEDETQVLGRHATRAEAEEQLALIERRKNTIEVTADETKTMQWKDIERRLDEEIEEVCDVLKQATSEYELFDLLDVAVEEQKGAWFATLTGVYLGVGEGFAEEVFNQLKSQTGPTEFKVDDQRMYTWETNLIQYLDAAFASKFLEMSHTSRDNIRTLMDQYLAGGMSWNDVADEVAKTMPRAHGVRVRAERIARTETLTAASASNHMAAEATGLPMVKTWFGTPDDRARRWHRDGILAADLKTAFAVKRPGKNPNKGEFLGTDRLMFPGDWSLGASAGNIINCRCVEFFDVIEG